MRSEEFNYKLARETFMAFYLLTVSVGLTPFTPVVMQ